MRIILGEQDGRACQGERGSKGRTAEDGEREQDASIFGDEGLYKS